MADADSCCMLTISTMADPRGTRNKFKVLSLYVSNRNLANSNNVGWLHGKTIWNIEHGLEDGTFTDPEVPSHMRVEGKSTLLTALRRGRRCAADLRLSSSTKPLSELAPASAFVICASCFFRISICWRTTWRRQRRLFPFELTVAECS